MTSELTARLVGENGARDTALKTSSVTHKLSAFFHVEWLTYIYCILQKTWHLTLKKICAWFIEMSISGVVACELL